MTRKRYFQWLAVWKRLPLPQSESAAAIPLGLCTQLQEMWEEDLKSCTADQLAAYSAAWAKTDSHFGPDLTFLKDLKAFLKDLKRMERDARKEQAILAARAFLIPVHACLWLLGLLTWILGSLLLFAEKAGLKLWEESGASH